MEEEENFINTKNKFGNGKKQLTAVKEKPMNQGEIREKQ